MSPSPLLANTIATTPRPQRPADATTRAAVHADVTASKATAERTPTDIAVGRGRRSASRRYATSLVRLMPLERVRPRLPKAIFEARLRGGGGEAL